MLDQDLQNILDIIDKKAEKTTKIQLFDLLASYTYKNYQNELGDIIKVFPTPISTITDWETLISKKESNTGKEVEQVIAAYSEQHGVKATPIRGKGTDVTIGEKPVEIKSAAKNTINTMLQTSFYKNNPNKFYAFVSNTDKKDISIRIVSSQLLYRITLGHHIVDELNNGSSNLLTSQINEGLNKLDFQHFIETSIIKGESANVDKSFKIGKDIRVRFVIYIEPK